MTETFFTIFGIMVFLGIFVLLKRKRKKISPETLAMAKGKIQNTSSLDPNHALLESHKIFVSTIQSLFPEKNNLTAAQVTKLVASRFPNQPRIWSFHGLRNKAAHETDIRISIEQANSARTEFIRALEALSG
ncbi:LPXTG cell wall anchor domain-containing protein [Candidatus Gracilibacteria bacterium]|nr:LPXTG cell wall anchor domain-containing protein [Candidatus Gracilibacteria bacterium]